MIKLFENFKKRFKIGDYVRIIDDEALEYIDAGIYGKNIKLTDIFQITEIDNGVEENGSFDFDESFYLLNIYGYDIDWYPARKLESVSDIEVSALKYNL
jgi:hypothetical protein